MMMEWSKAWRMPVNLSNTMVIHLGSLPPTEFKFDNKLLPSITEPRDLGAYLDKEMKFSKHIDIMVREAFSFSFLLSSFRNLKCNDSSLLIILYKTYAIPILGYCFQVWSPYTKKELGKN